jgi:hypothetical protein
VSGGSNGSLLDALTVRVWLCGSRLAMSRPTTSPVRIPVAAIRPINVRKVTARSAGPSRPAASSRALISSSV